MYQREETSVRLEIQNLKDKNADEYEIKKKEEALAETLTVLPNTKNRLAKSYLELISLMEQIEISTNFEQLSKVAEWSLALHVRESLSGVV